MTQDYSVWLTPERLAIEEEAWRESAMYRQYAAAVLDLLSDEGARSVLEVGCGTGWVPTCLPASVDYTGVDAHLGCLELGARKTDRLFINADIRGLVTNRRDVVCAFAFLKHFALHEWTHIVRRLLSFGRFGLFTMNVGKASKDDFEQGFPHTWVDEPTLAAAVAFAGHDITRTDTLHTGETLVRTVCIRS